jgi:hypothetical protein
VTAAATAAVTMTGQGQLQQMQQVAPIFHGHAKMLLWRG